MKKYLFLIVVAVAFILGVFVGYKLFRPEAHTQVNAEVILTALQSQGFLVSQNYVFSETVTIDRSTGNQFKDFFLGQTIEAAAQMKVSSGVDLTKITSEDVRVTDSEVRITLPAVSTQSVELLGNIVLKNNQGIIKRIVDNDDGYNLALTELKQQATAAVQVPELRAEAGESATDEITRLLQFIAPEKQVAVEVKK